MALKNETFFQKTYEKSPDGWGLCPQIPKASGGWGPRPQTPACDTFELHQVSQHIFKVRCLHFSNISLIPLPLQNPGYVPTGTNFRSSIRRYLYPTKTSSLEKF